MTLVIKRVKRGEKTYYYSTKVFYKSGLGGEQEHLGPATISEVINYGKPRDWQDVGSRLLPRIRLPTMSPAMLAPLLIALLISIIIIMTSPIRKEEEEDEEEDTYIYRDLLIDLQQECPDLPVNRIERWFDGRLIPASASAKIDKKSRIAIPKSVMKSLDWNSGDHISIHVEGRGLRLVRAKSDNGLL